MRRNPKKRDVGVILAGGGSGSRFGKRGDKLFVPLAGKPLLAYSLDVFSKIPEVCQIVLVVPKARLAKTSQYVKRQRVVTKQEVRVIAGGATRQDSVWEGFMALSPTLSAVLVHDVARPLFTPFLVKKLLRVLPQSHAVIPGVPVVDTMKATRLSRRSMRRTVRVVEETFLRDRLVAVQTPQAFSWGVLLAAFLHAKQQGIIGTDEASLVEQMGGTVEVIPGEPGNLKVTTPEDMPLATWRVQRRSGRKR